MRIVGYKTWWSESKRYKPTSITNLEDFEWQMAASKKYLGVV